MIPSLYWIGECKWQHGVVWALVIGGLTGCEAMVRMPMMDHMRSHHPTHMTSGPAVTVEPDALPEKTSADAQLFMQYCQQCHSLPAPSQHTAGEWPKVVQRMRANMRTMNKQEPSDLDAVRILDYLKRNARRT